VYSVETLLGRRNGNGVTQPQRFAAVSALSLTLYVFQSDDNGYKVYWGNGCQIIAPHDKGIARCIGIELPISLL